MLRLRKDRPSPLNFPPKYKTHPRCEVEVIDAGSPDGGYPLNPRYDLRHHSPTGFEWGYGGSGPAQLALALLADALGDDEQARRHYQDFKFKVVASLPQGSWELSEEDIRQRVADLAQGRSR